MQNRSKRVTDEKVLGWWLTNFFVDIGELSLSGGMREVLCRYPYTKHLIQF